MSSDYRLLCMNHDPAIALDREAGRSEEMVTLYVALKQGEIKPDDGYGDVLKHADCKLMIGRYSYPLIELGCLDGGDHGHQIPKWIDVNVLRLLQFAYESEEDASEAVKPFLKCFGPTFVLKLRDELAR